MTLKQNQAKKLIAVFMIMNYNPLNQAKHFINSKQFNRRLQSISNNALFKDYSPATKIELNKAFTLQKSKKNLINKYKSKLKLTR